MAIKKKISRKSSKKTIPSKDSYSIMPKSLRGEFGANLPKKREVVTFINSKIRNFIDKSSTHIIDYHRSWNDILPAYVKCILKLNKVKFNDVPAISQLVRVMGAETRLNQSLINSVRENNIQILAVAMYEYIRWYNDKNK